MIEVMHAFVEDILILDPEYASVFLQPDNLISNKNI